MTQEFCVNALIAKLVTDLVNPPNYDALREQIASHDYVLLKDKQVYRDDCSDTFTSWYKILFTASDCVVVQAVLLDVTHTRFAVYKVPLSKWEGAFDEWIDEDHSRYYDCHNSFQEGMRTYGADV